MFEKGVGHDGVSGTMSKVAFDGRWNASIYRETEISGFLVTLGLISRIVLNTSDFVVNKTMGYA
jgi:hypothetical protein